MIYFDVMPKAKFRRLKARYAKDCKITQAEVDAGSVAQCIELDNIRRAKMAQQRKLLVREAVRESRKPIRLIEREVDNERLQKDAEDAMRYGGRM